MDIIGKMFFKEGPTPRLWVYAASVLWVMGLIWIVLHFTLKYW